MDNAVKLAIELTLMVALMAGWTLLSLLRTEENWAGSPELPASIDGSVEAVDSCSDYSETPKETDGWSSSLVSPAATNDLHSSPEPPAGTEAGPVPARPLVEKKPHWSFQQRMEVAGLARLHSQQRQGADTAG